MAKRIGITVLVAVLCAFGLVSHAQNKGSFKRGGGECDYKDKDMVALCTRVSVLSSELAKLQSRFYSHLKAEELEIRSRSQHEAN